MGSLVSFVKYGRLSEAIYGRVGCMRGWGGGGGTPTIGIDYWELAPDEDELPRGLL
jgi:hypothetical protein